MPELLEAVTDAEKTFALLAKLVSQQHDIIRHLDSNVLDVDEYTVPNASGTVFRPLRNYYKPIIIEQILAIFPTASTLVTITLGPRIIPVTNIAAGIFTMDTRMQLDMDDDRFMTIAPAGVGYLELMGRADAREMNRK